MKTSIEVIVDYNPDTVTKEDIARRLYWGSKRIAAHTKDRVPFRVDSFRIGPSVAGIADPMPRVDPEAQPVRCGGLGCHTDSCDLWGVRCSVLHGTVCGRGFTAPAQPEPRRECSGPLPGRDVTVVQTGDKTLFVRPLDCQGFSPDGGRGKVSLP